MKYFILLLLYFFNAAFATTPVIIQKPILFDAKRIELTREYRQQHYGIKEKSIVIVPKMIVLHWTGDPSLQSVFNFLYPPVLKGRPDIEQSPVDVNVSAQFLVDRDGRIYQLMPSNWMARHIIGLNNIAIGIENVGTGNLTQAQVTANAALIRYLAQQYPSIRYLIGHYEYGRFKDTALWQEKDPNYFTHKVDPGPQFMRAIRSKVQDLHLKDQP